VRLRLGGAAGAQGESHDGPSMVMRDPEIRVPHLAGNRTDEVRLDSTRSRAG